jgi:mono/diheme cytochrome c family protein
MFLRVKTPVREFVVGTGALPAETRRDIVDTTACLKCHVGSLYQHGNTRVDNVTLCVMCHNPASSDQNNRVAMGVVASEAYDGLVGQTYEMKTMLHRIHTAGALDDDDNAVNPALSIYRTRGLYGWAVDMSMLANWPVDAADRACTKTNGTVGNQVFGALPYVPATATAPEQNPNSCQPHSFYSPTYPRLFNDCAACHVAGSVDNLPDQSKAVATTLNAGTPTGTNWSNQLDDTLQGASAAACTSCHTSTDAKGHAYQNGWTPQVFPNGRQTIIDTN